MLPLIISVLGALYFIFIQLYLTFFITNANTIFPSITNFFPESIDAPHKFRSNLNEIIVTNILLVILFGLQHSIMARNFIKTIELKFIPKTLERTVYIVVSSLLVHFMMIQWKSYNMLLWDIKIEALRLVLWSLALLGVSLITIAIFSIDGLDFIGIKQPLRAEKYKPPKFKFTGIYSYIRHPMMLGFILVLFATPTMTINRLMIAALFTLYIFLALPLEEQTTLSNLGKPYEEYKKQVPMIIPYKGSVNVKLQ